MIGREVVVDDPQSASSTLAPPRIGPAQLSESTCAGHQISKLGVGGHTRLHTPILVVIQIEAQVTRKRRCFDELHTRETLYLYAISVLSVAYAISVVMSSAPPNMRN